MSKFKKGDRVKMVGIGNNIPVGSTGIVKTENYGAIDVKWDRGTAYSGLRKGRMWCVDEELMELLDKAKFKVGDKVKIVGAGKFTARGGSVIGAVGVIEEIDTTDEPIKVVNMVPPPPDGSKNMDWFTEDALELVTDGIEGLDEKPTPKKIDPYPPTVEADSSTRRYKVGDKVRILDKATYLRVKAATDGFDEVGDPGEDNVEMDAVYGTVQEIENFLYTRSYRLKGICPGVFYDKMFDLSYGSETTTKDAINPSHYKQGKVECIDAIASATINLSGEEAVDTANVIKYLWRWKEKNGLTDLNKANWYLQRLIKTAYPDA